ncbi:MAG TPA: FAD-dependent oxidoreductase [Thermotogota bacterium]|nr:FAD-dependent oxidoreductase [Thermotogota bacterium]HPJ87536.1 FAD-dependent oxidoreductase [Thermotogota bacterium]HPR94741.1 FAD-dependent oxidoreductase [Thermotogota bacterium]
MREINLDALVIGGGAAGMAAAVELTKNGCKTILIERDGNTGGVLNQCIHNGFGLHVFKEELTGPEYADRYRKIIKNELIDVHSQQFVLEVNPQKREVITVGTEGLTCYKPTVLIMTTGARERPFSNLRIPGSRPAGIYTAGVAQKFVNLQNYLPGEKAFVLGSGDIGLIMARRLTLEGMKVLGVAELMPFSGGLARNISQCLDDYDIPLYLSTSVVKVKGKERLESIILMDFTPDTLQPIPGTEREIKCDTLILSVGLLPQNELIESFVDIDPVNRGVIVDSHQQTTHPWIFAAGNNVAVYDLVDFVTLEGIHAGKSAAEKIKNGFNEVEKINVTRGENVGAITPLQCCLDDKEFKFYIRPRKNIKKGRLLIGDGIVNKIEMGLKPSEMIDITITAKHKANIREIGLNNLKVEIQEVE